MHERMYSQSKCSADGNLMLTWSSGSHGLWCLSQGTQVRWLGRRSQDGAALQCQVLRINLAERKVKADLSTSDDAYLTNIRLHVISYDDWTKIAELCQINDYFHCYLAGGGQRFHRNPWTCESANKKRMRFRMGKGFDTKNSHWWPTLLYREILC